MKKYRNPLAFISFLVCMAAVLPFASGKYLSSVGASGPAYAGEKRVAPTAVAEDAGTDGPTATAADVEERQGRKSLLSAYGKLPLSFEANRGQTDRNVKFMARGSGYNFFLTPEEVVLLLTKHEPRAGDEGAAGEGGPRGSAGSKVVSRTVLRMRFLGAEESPAVAGLDEAANRTNYYIGNDPRKWQAGIANYRKVKYTGLYKGVDAIFYGKQSQLEYDFVVAPGADPGVIALEVTGADSVVVDASGELVLDTPGGEIRQPKPFIYQEIDGARKEVTGGYVVRNNNQVGFRLGEYDRTRELVIDPELIWSTYLGGVEGDVPATVGLDPSGDVYVAGTAISPDFPAGSISGEVFQAGRGDLYYEDAFVTKINATATQIIYSTFIGGVYGDDAYDMAVDPGG